MQEIWKDIEGYEGLYQVSNTGVVRSLDRYVPHKKFGQKYCEGHIMATHIINSGYVRVNLCKGNRYKSFSVHRLVALAFIENPKGLPEVNHIDENKENNNVNNLEWVTKEQNEKHGTKKVRGAEKKKIKVLQYSVDGKFLKEWASATDAEMCIAGKFTGGISHCANGQTKTSYGYIWRFKEAE